VEANPTGSTPSLRIDRTLHTTRWTTAPVAEARFVTVLETTSALAPEPSALRSVQGGEYDFGDEWIAVADDGVLHGSRVSGRGLAVVSSRGRLAVVAGTELELADGPTLSRDSPFTGVLTP
jgi:hypothetical protein